MSRWTTLRVSRTGEQERSFTALSSSVMQQTRHVTAGITFTYTLACAFKQAPLSLSALSFLCSMFPLKLPQAQASQGRTPLINQVASHPAGRRLSHTDYNENAWRYNSGHTRQSSADSRASRRGSGSRGGLIDMVPLTTQGRPALHSDREVTNWSQCLETPRVLLLPNPPNIREPAAISPEGRRGFSAREWRKDQRARNAPAVAHGASEANNSPVDHRDCTRMGLSQRYVRSFRHHSHQYNQAQPAETEGSGPSYSAPRQSENGPSDSIVQIRSFGLLGFASMQLAIWGKNLLLLS